MKMAVLLATILAMSCPGVGWTLEQRPLRTIEIDLPSMVGRHCLSPSKVPAFELSLDSSYSHVAEARLRLRGAAVVGRQYCCFETTCDTIPHYYQFTVFVQDNKNKRFCLAVVAADSSGEFEATASFETAGGAEAVDILTSPDARMSLTGSEELTCCCHNCGGAPEATITEATLLLDVEEDGAGR